MALKWEITNRKVVLLQEIEEATMKGEIGRPLRQEVKKFVDRRCEHYWFHLNHDEIKDEIVNFFCGKED